MFRTVRSVCNMFAEKWKNSKAFATAFDKINGIVTSLADLQKAADKKDIGDYRRQRHCPRAAGKVEK